MTAPEGDAVRVSTADEGGPSNPAIARLDDGRAVVVWTRAVEGTRPSIVGQRLGADGRPEGPYFQVNATSGGIPYAPVVAMGADGRFVVAWEARSRPESPKQIFFKRFTWSGEPMDPADVRVGEGATVEVLRPAVGMDASGRFTIVWEGGPGGSAIDDIYRQRYSASGEPDGGVVRLNAVTIQNHTDPSIAMNAAGASVVTWSTYNQALDPNEVIARWYGPDGSAASGEVQVNTVWRGNQSAARTAMNAAGAAAIAWADGPAEENPTRIIVRRFGPGGSRPDDPMDVGTGPTGFQHDLSVGIADDERVVVAWERIARENGTHDVFARWVGTGEACRETRIATGDATDLQAPAVAMDGRGRVTVVWQESMLGTRHAAIYARRFARRR